MLVAPSLLSADFARLAEESRRALAAGADWLHLDVMDGHFVPNLTFGVPVIRAIHRACPDAVLDCHFMVSDPRVYLRDLAEAGAAYFTFHLEAPAFRGAEGSEGYIPEGEPGQLDSARATALALLRAIRAAGMRAGVSIRPKTPASHLSDDLLRECDLVLLMSVEPGFGGQAYMPECAEKARELRQRRAELGAAFLIEIDGGISGKTVAHARECGVDAVVSGSYVFGSPDISGAISSLK